MRRIIQRLPFAVILVLLFVPGLLYPGLARAASDTLDQSQTSNGYYRGFGHGWPAAQIFTAGLGGYLDRVSVYLENYATYPATGPITVSIQTVNITTGLPGTQIGSGRIPLNAIPPGGAPGWVDANIDTAYVAAGTQYALVLSMDSSGDAIWWGAGDLYPGGYEMYNTAYGTFWDNGYDFMFKTYVIPDTLDEIGSQSQTSGTGTPLGTTPVGQTFTIGVHGLLGRVSVYLTNTSTNPSPITLTILKVASNGLPAIGTEVASGTIPAETIPRPGHPGWVSASLVSASTAPLIVTPGMKYALLLQTNASGPEWAYVSDVYPGGAEVTPKGISWTTAPYDFAFQTYVRPPILDQSQIEVTAAHVFGAYGGVSLAQYFTAQVSGLLDHVNVLLAGYFVSSKGVWVGIYNLTSTVPIGSGTIPFEWSEEPVWVGVSFSDVYVTAGSQYSLTLASIGGNAQWLYHVPDNYSGGYELRNTGDGWVPLLDSDMTFQTYVLPLPSQIAKSPVHGITPCSNGFCPAASGGFNPADLTEGVTSRFQFQERSDGTVQGILNFNDPRANGIALRGCTTESAACLLTVTTFACTDTHSLTLGGTYTPHGGTATNYRLTLSGVSNGLGTFKLTAGDYTFTLTLDGIVNVTCPSVAAR